MDDKKPLSKKEKKDWYRKTFGFLPPNFIVDFDVYYAKEKEKKVMALDEMLAINTVSWNYKLATTSGTVTPMCDVKQEKEETAMSTEQNAIDYLVRRVEDTRRGLSSMLETAFNLYVDNKPKTYKELIAAIKDGKFELDAKRTARIDLEFSGDDETEGYFCYRGPLDGIVWSGPKADWNGFNEAAKNLNIAKTDALDIIKTSTDADKRLQALKDFEKWVPTNAPKN